MMIYLLFLLTFSFGLSGHVIRKDTSYDSYEIVTPFKLKRSRRTAVLEEKMEYEIPRNNDKLHLMLEKQKHFVFDKLSVTTSGKREDINYENDAVNCHYHGQLKDGSGKVAVTTCNGIRGVIVKDGITYYIEPKNDNGKHIIYTLNKKEKKIKHNDEMVNGEHILMENMLKRTKRSIAYNTTGKTKYIGMALVVDDKFYNKKNGDIQAITQFAMSVVNYANFVYNQVNFKIIVTQFEILTDNTTLNTDTDVLTNFEIYDRDVLKNTYFWKHDNAHLLTDVHYGHLVGLSSLGTLCTEMSNAFSMTFSSNPYTVGKAFAHEVGHNIGLSHYGSECKCSTTSTCVMSGWIGGGLEFTDCSLNHLKQICLAGRCECLLDVPTMVVLKYTYTPTCGNGVIDEGEDCDCGAPDLCRNPCCDANTCTLASNGECANGKCCDTSCKIMHNGTLCRSPKDNACDVAEHCNGIDNECPADTYKVNLLPCRNQTSYCYNGACAKTHTAQCVDLYGTGALFGKCYSYKNTRGTRFYNCGTSSDGSYKACPLENVLCGKLLCSGGTSSWVKIGYNRQRIEYTGEDGANCRASFTHLYRDMADLTLTVDGTKCGDGKACINYKCQTVEACGTCNSDGTCVHNKCCKGKSCQDGYVCNNNKCVLDACDGCLNGGVCNNETLSCRCPAGRSCPHCKNINPLNLDGETCNVISPGNNDIACGNLYFGSYTLEGCKAQLGGVNSDMVLLKNYRNLIDWNNFSESVRKITCNCAYLAHTKGNYKTVGIQYLGECWGSLRSVEELNTKPSTRCYNVAYKECGSNDVSCVGETDSTYLYSLPKET